VCPEQRLHDHAAAPCGRQLLRQQHAVAGLGAGMTSSRFSAAVLVTFLVLFLLAIYLSYNVSMG
jgi:hypothetical protein